MAADEAATAALTQKETGNLNKESADRPISV